MKIFNHRLCRMASALEWLLRSFVVVQSSFDIINGGSQRGDGEQYSFHCMRYFPHRIYAVLCA